MGIICAGNYKSGSSYKKFDCFYIYVNNIYYKCFYYEIENPNVIKIGSKAEFIPYVDRDGLKRASKVRIISSPVDIPERTRAKFLMELSEYCELHGYARDSIVETFLKNVQIDFHFYGCRSSYEFMSKFFGDLLDVYSVATRSSSGYAVRYRGSCIENRMINHKYVDIVDDYRAEIRELMEKRKYIENF